MLAKPIRCVCTATKASKEHISAIAIEQATIKAYSATVIFF